MTRRGVKVQLIVFAAITLVAVSLLSARYVGLFDRVAGGRYVVTADFADSGGIFTGAEVTYRGVTVGRVDRLRLTEGGVLVDLRMDRDARVPRDTEAVVENRSAVGEQYVDLQPRRDGGPYLTGGARIPRSSTRIPPRVDQVLADVDGLARSVDLDDLSTTVRELGTAFAGTGPDLQRLLDSGDALTRSATEALPETVRLIDDGRTVLTTQQESAGDIRSFARDLADLSTTVRDSDPDLRRVLDRGVLASREIDSLLRDNRTDLGVLLTNLVTIGQVAVSRTSGIEQLLVTYPDVVAGGFTVVPGDGTAHFGLVLNLDDPPACTRGYEGTDRIGPNQTTDLPPLNTAARCDEPRGSSIDVRGAQNAPTGGRSGDPAPATGASATADSTSSADGDPASGTAGTPLAPQVRALTPPPGVPNLTWLLTGGLS
jgi:phospholipid/cholesterol/gamma-HCH transport system substrate-binding protein